MSESVFVEYDLAGADWVVTAYLSQDERMLNIVRAGIRPHGVTGSLISGAPKDLVELEAKLVGHTTDPDEVRARRKELPQLWQTTKGLVPVSSFFFPRNMSIDQMGKKANHGLNYNMGYRRFALEFGLMETDAKRIEYSYKHEAYPGLTGFYYPSIERELKQCGRALTNCFGYRRTFLDRWGPELLNAAYSFKPQGTVGEVTKRGMVRIYNDRTSLKDVALAAQVHDSVLCDHRFSSVDQLTEQIRICTEYMKEPITYYGDTFTLRVDAKLGFSWGESSMVSVDIDNLDAVLAEARKHVTEVA